MLCTIFIDILKLATRTNIVYVYNLFTYSETMATLIKPIISEVVITRGDRVKNAGGLTEECNCVVGWEEESRGSKG